jgi:hypothetical protein
MKKIALAVSLVALAGPGFAAGEKEATSPAGDPMANWVPPKVQNEQADRKEILALFKSMENAEKKGDLSAAAALVDFPVLMVTDDLKGQAMSGSWDKEKWTKVMEPFYKHPMQGVKVTHKPTIFMISDSLASVDDQATITHGNKTIRARNSTLLVRKEGRWFVKAMVEGGWGDVMKETPAAASGETSPQTGTGASGGTTGTESGTGTSGGSTGTESGTGTSTGTGAGTATPPQTPPTPPQPQGAPSDTTK